MGAKAPLKTAAKAALKTAAKAHDQTIVESAPVVR